MDLAEMSARHLRTPTADLYEQGVRWQYVDVVARVHADGFPEPLEILWPDGRRFKVDGVRSCRRVGSDKAAWSYEVEVCGRVRRMWMRRGAFFVVVQSGGVKACADPPAMDVYRMRKQFGLRV